MGEFRKDPSLGKWSDLFKGSHTAPKPGLTHKSLKVESRALGLVLHLVSLAEGF